MSQANPLAPSTAKVADVRLTEAAPALWNPSAAASWSLLFSPIFGSYLHARNWEALGQPEKAASSRKWMVVSIIFFVAIVLAAVVLPDSKAADGVGKLGGFALLIAWYYTIGKSQQVYVVARFGKEYPRRGWSKPLLAALGVSIVFVVVLAIFGFVTGALSSVG
jgi:hypothetical protein